MAIIRISLQPAGDQVAGEHDTAQGLSTQDNNRRNKAPFRVLVDSQAGRKICQTSEELLATIDLPSQKDVQWYFEDYVINEPFASARARAVRRKLRKQGQQLLRDYLHPVVQLDDEYPPEFLLEVRKEHAESSVAHALHQFAWEILEDTDLWQDVFQAKPRKVIVVRVHGNANLGGKPGPADLCSSTLKATNVIAITARPSHTKDIPHRLITRSISSAIDAIREQSNSPATLEIVRPGTFKALEHHLQQFSCGYFQVVHLDVHGDADSTGYFRTLLMWLFDRLTSAN